ncbi:CHD3-type chromatin-remodeling factor PICKLE [Sesamum alatum]|uniref:CHD3-type chromatin-remodeling factor PICKLE n=1 Tax=Sesamum alatum TaxID=300844 RepID=A0AAE2CAV0_9LAMI|nr:CHD3-type chromatin-remodeling factor PICKLE [Sesamum alatum]
MASLVERLRVRSDRRPIYNLDESDEESDFMKKKSGAGPSSDKIEKIERPDVKEGLCQACGKDDNLWSCETCNYAYHPKCLLPPSRGPPPSSWKCPECVGHLNELEKILDCEMRPGPANDSDAAKLGTNQVLMKHYLVKWKGLSYLHCTWVPEMEFVKAYKSNPRLRTKVNNFHKQASSSNNSEDEYVPIRPDWTTVDRIIACREVEEEKEYLIKWKELPYDECYWELESSIASFHKEIEKFNRIQSPHDKVSVKQKSNLRDAMESKKKQKEFQQYESSPDFLSGGSLHPYQLEGLNFLRFAWSKQTHVILADEMGLGKTIQSIAFLASLFEENLSPHLVVAPLSTLRNWEREFATWAPHMNVVMYVGSAQARNVIREYEFYYPKNQKKSKKKKSGQAVSESKQDRIKFDVLLTSYEMINLDSSSLKPIKWECMIVDEGHRLKNKDSKLFSSLKQYCSRHRVLLTGTPLQNNLDELFMLMHFLDAGKFGSLEEFQEEFKDINQEEQISRLHKMLAPHLLRRVKKDVLTELPPKKELILRVELSSKQKEYYKAILTRNYQILTRKGGAQISLINVVMELRKLCCHPFMLGGVEPEDANEFNKQLLETSGKLQLLDKMMVKLKEQGHRVLIYTQFQHMLDLLEEYCNYRKWSYERIDGKVTGAERQIRIDRFNAKNSSRFCFLLSTRAGGLGINLATADTVIIYDSDWNPHADLQAMARAHRLGQTNKVMIFRLIARGTIEERMMQMTKKKMVLEHLVVGRLKAQNINQEELDDIIRYGSKELFADDNDESVKSRQIHYDDTAIDRLLDREQVGDEEAAVDDEEEDGFLKAFKVANFEYVDEAELAAEEETPVPPAENKASVNSSERASYWEDLLRDKYEVHKVEEFSTMGKGKRSRKQMVSVEEDDLAGLEDVSSDAEDDNYEAELTDNETASGAAAVRRTYRKRARADTSEKLPLMEGEGRYFRVLGFNQNQRAVFVQILMRFGVGEYDWAEFAPRLKQKTYDEINDYGRLFLTHIIEEITDSPTFSDGVPKEGLRIEDVLVRIGTLSLIRDKVKALAEGSILFTDDILARYPGLKGGRVWKEHHDRLLLRAVQKHGYGRWQAIVDDKDLRIQEVICQELNLSFINAPVPGAPQAQNPASGTSQPQYHPSGMSQTQASASGVSQPHTPTPGFSQSQNGVNSDRVEAPGNLAKGTTGRNDFGADVAQGATDTPARAQLFQDQSTLYHFREMQRRQVEFIKKRVLLLEKGLTAELQKVHFADVKTSYVPNGETGHKVTDLKSPSSEASDAQMIDQLPQVELFSPEEILALACDKSKDRLDMARLYNEVSRIIADNGQDVAEASYRPASLRLRKNLGALEAFNEEMNHILSSVQQSSPLMDKLTSKEAEIENVGSSSTILATDAMDTDNPIQSSSQAEPNEREIGNVTAAESFSNGVADMEMEDTDDDNSEKSAREVINMD